MTRAELLQATGRALLLLWAASTIALDDARWRGTRVPAFVGRAVEHLGQLAVAVWRRGAA